MSAEQKLAVAQEKRLCLFCFKHLDSQKCFAKTDAQYKGCGVNGCKEHHHADLHFLMITARLFSVHAQPAEAESETLVF